MSEEIKNPNQVVNNQLNIIQIDKNINNEENQKYLNYLKSLNNTPIPNINTNQINNGLNIPNNLILKPKYEVNEFVEIEKAMEKIKTIRFIETIIIVSGSFLPDLIKKFKANLKDIYVIPKFIVFTGVGRVFSDEILKEHFYLYGKIKTSFEDIRNFINVDSQRLQNEANQKQNNNLKNSQFEQKPKVMFERIEKESDLLLPKIYEKLLEKAETKNNPIFIKNMYMIYKNNVKYNYLLNQMVDIPDIPIEILSKYYIRLYSLGEDLVKKMNNDLLTDYNKNNIIYQPFIKTLYVGLEKEFFNIFLGSPLFSPQTLSENEIQDIWRYKENFKQNNLNGLEKDLPRPIIISKSFLTFYKDMNEAEKYLRFGKNAIITIINFEQAHNLYTHADIEGLSYFPNEREVLFFPFSFYGIDDFLFDPIKKIYNLKLVYLGKFNNFSTSKQTINNSFKDNLLKTCLLDNEQVNSIKTEEINTKVSKSKFCLCCT